MNEHEGERALEYALKINMPGLWTALLALAVVNSQLGHMEQACGALRGLEELGIWWQAEMVAQMDY